jgi:copper oxidase (laccase) domain-containing protein
MRDGFGALPGDVYAALGPAIGPCCYEVGEDVAEKWRHVAGAEFTGALEARADRFQFDLSAANLLVLRRAGVLTEHIETASICTRCCGEHWFSHRGQGANTGRFGAMIALIAKDQGGTT